MVLIDSKESSPPTCLSLPCATLHCFVYSQVNNGFWSFLDYVEDVCWSPSSPFFKSLTQTLCIYCHIYLTPDKTPSSEGRSRVLREMMYRVYCIDSIALGETQGT